MQRLTKSTKIVSTAILALCLATGVAFAGANYQYGGQYGYHNNTNREAAATALDMSTASGNKAIGGPAYQTSGQYAGSPALGNVLDMTTASGNAPTGVTCDLNTQYFYDNYFDQLYDCSYCDWSK